MTKDELFQCHKAINHFIETEQFDEALPLIYSCLEEYPNNASTLHYLGYLYLVSGREAWAYQFLRRALQEHPDKVVWCSLGRAAHELGMYQEAINCFLKSAELDPSYALAYQNAAATLVQTSRWDDGEKAARMALEVNPGLLGAELNLAHCLLAKGQWVEGFKHWSKSLGCKYRKEWVYGDEVRWDGSPNKRLVIYGEQGLGDEIFYASCVNDALDISQKVWIDCDPKLTGLFKRSFPKAEVHGTRLDQSPPWVTGASIEARAPIGGLPEFFRKTDKDFSGLPYLKACPDRHLMWKSLFKSWGKKVIGITTHGGRKNTNEKGRQISLDDWLPVLQNDKYEFVSLDYKENPELEMFCELNGVKIHTFNTITQSKDYDDTAGLISALDMVVGVNTTALHCSAALGVKTIALIPEFHQWRYAYHFVPWYRSMRMIHQDQKPWSEVLERVSKEVL